jgi:hypothetical protein
MNILTLPTQVSEQEGTKESLVSEQVITEEDDENIQLTEQKTGVVSGLPIEIYKYTDVELEDYNGLYATLKAPLDEPNNNTVVTFYLKSYVDGYIDSDEVSPAPYFSNTHLKEDYSFEKLYGPNMFMEIINKEKLVSENTKSLFDQEVLRIKNKYSGTENLTITLPQSDKYMHSFSKVLEEIEYPNTDYSVALLNIPIYPVGAILNENSNENIGIELEIFVQGVKDNNIITLKSEISDTEFLGITREEHMSCTRVGGEDSPTALYYNLSCMEDLITSDKYYSKVLEMANDLIKRFAIKE